MLATILNPDLGLKVQLSKPDGHSGLDTPSQNLRDHVIGKSCGGMQVIGAHKTMMGRLVVFCVVVAKVGATQFPVDKEVALAVTIFDPVEAHVDRLGSLLLDGIVGEPF